MKLTRRKRQSTLISLTPLVDVMMILLVFFMVTSSYLDLDMMPMVQPTEAEGVAPPPPGGPAPTLLIRITADGAARLRGQVLSVPMLAAALRDAPQARVLLLPSGGADVQSLVSAIETATRAGAENLRVLRLEAPQ